MENLTYSEALVRINELERIVLKLQNFSTVSKELNLRSHDRNSNYKCPIKNFNTPKFDLSDVTSGTSY